MIYFALVKGIFFAIIAVMAEISDAKIIKFTPLIEDK
jgi:hypothetical protein